VIKAAQVQATTPEERVRLVVEACRRGGVEVDGARPWYGVQLYILLPGPPDHVPNASVGWPRYDLKGKLRFGVSLTSEKAVQVVLMSADTDVLRALATNGSTSLERHLDRTAAACGQQTEIVC